MLINLPALGALIAAQGGHFAGVTLGQDANGAPELKAIIVCERKHDILQAEWGNYGKEISGASSRTDGKANTASMLAADSPAATALSQVAVEGINDWHIPALCEMQIAASLAPDLFDSEGIYWTSTQAARSYAFVQGFAGGNSGWSGKGHRVPGPCLPPDSPSTLDHLNTFTGA